MSEKPFNRHRRKYGQTYAKGEKVRDFRLLHANQTTQNWLSRTEFQQKKLRKSIYSQTFTIPKSQDSPVTSLPVMPVSSGKSVEDSFHSNLLSKIPINSTIVGSSTSLVSPSSTPMNRSFNDDFKAMPLLAINAIGQENCDVATPANTAVPLQKMIYNNAIDAFMLVDNLRGFLNTSNVNLGTASSTPQITEPTMGVYGVRWRRAGEPIENETKLFINCIGECAMSVIQQIYT